MPLDRGARLGPYEIVSAIGAGGMGEVYRARDTRLGREVAIKVLPESFASDPDRLARFEREAQLLASLNHPNIATIHGLEEAGEAGRAGGAMRALVMELVEGPTLADRIAEGPIPIEEALPIARQIAEALEAAHERGVIHRDLKPANIKLRPDGTVKVLDFGLAKLNEPSGATIPTASLSPTITSPALITGVGVLLGTAAYMSPEQARGKVVDRRADIWAFGCVVYEMLTGKRMFQADDVTDVLVAVMRSEPDWVALPVATPPDVRKLLRRCVEKDPKHRLRDIGDARLELENPHPSVAVDVAVSKRSWNYALASTVAAGLFAGLALLILLMYLRQAPTEPPLASLQLLPPGKSTFGPIVVSPDGRRIAFTAADASGNEQLWVRQLDSSALQPLAGTDGASYPFWSPDSRLLGYFAGGKLKKIDVSSGLAQTICDLINDRGGARGGTWGRDGTILFSAERFGPEPIYQVSAAGGEPKPVESVEESGQQNHHHWPSFLPDGRHFSLLHREQHPAGAHGDLFSVARWRCRAPLDHNGKNQRRIRSASGKRA